MDRRLVRWKSCRPIQFRLSPPFFALSPHANRNNVRYEDHCCDGTDNRSNESTSRQASASIGRSKLKFLREDCLRNKGQFGGISWS
jgi:hypothetical protein